MTRKTLLICAFLAAGAALPARASADVVFYVGAHPLATKYGKGMCFILGPHVHSYVPHKRVLYVKKKKHWVFVGDPVEFEPEEPKHAYYGHHPLFWVSVTGPSHYCYIEGPHYHWHVPPGHLKFKKKGGAYWYVGVHPKWYRPRHWRVRALRSHYVGVRVHRPVITVEPPVGFVGVKVGPGGFQAGFKVHGPGFKVKGPGFGVKVRGGIGIGPFGIPMGKRGRHRGHRGRRGHWGHRGHHKMKFRGKHRHGGKRGFFGRAKIKGKRKRGRKW